MFLKKLRTWQPIARLIIKSFLCFLEFVCILTFVFIGIPSNGSIESECSIQVGSPPTKFVYQSCVPGLLKFARIFRTGSFSLGSGLLIYIITVTSCFRSSRLVGSARVWCPLVGWPGVSPRLACWSRSLLQRDAFTWELFFHGASGAVCKTDRKSFASKLCDIGVSSTRKQTGQRLAWRVPC